MKVNEPKQGQPRSVYFTTEYGNSGIQIEYVKSTDTFYISGWYDSMVGIEGGVVSRSELLTALGVE